MTDNPVISIGEKLRKHRNTGAKGTEIKMHRALRSLTLDGRSIIAVVFFPLLFDVLLWIKLDAITAFWSRIFHFWTKHLQLGVTITDVNKEIFFGRFVAIPFPDLIAVLPSETAIWINIVACLLIFLVSMAIPKKFLPGTYLLRAGLIIQLSASVFFLFSPHAFPYDISSYCSGLLLLGLYLLFLVSPVLALIYYIFDFSILKKVAVTAAIILYFIVLLPFLYLLHALIIAYGSLLFLPVLYLMFGPLLLTLMFVGWYAWAMTRKD